MAAPPSKPSPSSCNESSNSSTTNKDDTGKPATEIVAMTKPEESSTEESPTKMMSTVATDTTIPTYKSLRESTAYATAKKLLDEGDFDGSMELSEAAIQENLQLLASLGMSEDDIGMHESMAPFHYLYGSTLLYSLEESTAEPMTVPTADASEPQDGGALAANHEEDMQIAWENLDLARTIVEMLWNHSNKDDPLLALDLAQIRLREADLQRINGRNVEAIRDYQECLRLRKQFLEPYHRKIADVHYHLGLTSATTKAGQDQAIDHDYARQALHHYVECAKALCGHIALLCGANPIATIYGSTNLKTTGEDEDGETFLSREASSALLQGMRQRVASLTPNQSQTQATVHDMKELLDEIQETVDEAENAQQGVREVAELKVKAAAAAEQEDAAGTTVGFSAPTMTASAEPPADQPVMVIKKKKKRPPSDSKPSARDTNKRAKTE